MAFKVTSAKWLETESARITSILLMPRFWHKVWDDKSLLAALQEIGLNYTLKEVSLLNDELHKQGIVEDVTGPVPQPAPEPV